MPQPQDRMTDDVVARAAAFAKAAHGSIDQRRKGAQEPYIVHPRAVAEMVASVTDDPAMLAAAWLHDVVEDTPVTIEAIESEFGPDIAGLVADLTDVSKPSDGNRQQRKAIELQHTANADPRAKTVKLADVMSNLSDIAHLDPQFAATYLAEKEAQVAVLNEGHPALFERAQRAISESKRLLERGSV